MDWIEALILGIVQGLSEYLPISSSGHLEIFRQILGVDLGSENALAFDVVLHCATVLSTVVILWPMFYRLLKSFFTFKRNDDFYYVCKILVSCIPVAIVGFCFKDFVEQFFGNGLLVVGICLCITAFLLAFAHFTAVDKNGRVISMYKGHNISWVDAFVIGCAQAVAVLPGLSRSGTTIATGILLGDKRDKVAAFSFLMVIIPILGETLLNIKDMITEPEATQAVGWLPLVVGFLASFLVGCAACKWMINLVKKGRLVWFAIYCIIVGIICLAYNFLG